MYAHINDRSRQASMQTTITFSNGIFRCPNIYLPPLRLRHSPHFQHRTVELERAAFGSLTKRYHATESHMQWVLRM